MRLIRVFPRRTKATPDDPLAYVGPPDLFAQGDAVRISVAFTWDKPEAERLAEQWRHVAPVTIGGVAYGDPGKDFIPGRYIKHGYTFTSRGCPRRCWFFAMLRQQRRRVAFTGGLGAAALEDYQVGLLADLRPRPNCFWAYDPGDAFETLAQAAARLLAAGFTPQSHRLRCYVLIGYPKDTFEEAEGRLRAIAELGFTPMAMLWRPETASAQKWTRGEDWRTFQRRWARPALIHHQQAPRERRRRQALAAQEAGDGAG